MRLGATSTVLGLYQGVWAGLVGSERTRFLDRLSLLTDSQLADLSVGAGSLGSLNVNALARWVRTQSDPPVAAALADQAERKRAEPRASVPEKLRPYLRELDGQP